MNYKIKYLVNVLIVGFFLIGLNCLCDYDAEFKDAVSQFNAKNYVGAKNIFYDIYSKLPAGKMGDCFLYLLKCNYFLKDHSSLLTIYNQYYNEFKGTPFEPASMFVYANSLKDNIKDYSAALNIYEKIAKDFPHSPYAAPGSLLNAGIIKIQKFDNPQEGIDILKKLIAEYPDTDYADNAFVEIMEGYYKLKDRESLEKTRRELFEKYPASSQNARATFLLAEFCIKIERNRDDAIKYYKECYEKYPKSSSSTLAKIRAADLVPYNEINQSIKLYEEVLNSESTLSNSLKTWSKYQLGFAYLLKEDKNKAKEIFLSVVNDEKAEPKYKRMAQKYLNGINNPQSYDGAKLLVDCAIRYRRDLKAYDYELFSYAKYLGLYTTGQLEKFMFDNKCSDNEKAICLYDVSLAYYTLGEDEKAFNISKEIVEKYPNSGIGYDTAKFMMGYLNQKGGKLKEALDIYYEILNTSPNTNLTPRILLEIADCYIKQMDYKNALSALDSLIYLYNYRIEAKQASQIINILLLGREDLKSAYEKITIQKDISSNPIINKIKISDNNEQKRLYSIVDKILSKLKASPLEEFEFDKKSLTYLY